MRQLIGQFVLVRTRNAGVHAGTLLETSGTAVLLENVYRIWRWRGANSLNELSQQGADKDWTRISEPAPLNLLTEAIEVLLCSEKAKKNLSTPRWSKE